MQSWSYMYVGLSRSHWDSSGSLICILPVWLSPSSHHGLTQWVQIWLHYVVRVSTIALGQIQCLHLVHMNCGLIKGGQFQFHCVVPAEVHTTDLYHSSRVKCRKCGATYCTWSPRIKVWQIYLHTYICMQTNKCDVTTLDDWLPRTKVVSNHSQNSVLWFAIAPIMLRFIYIWWYYVTHKGLRHGMVGVDMKLTTSVSGLSKTVLGYHSRPSTFGRITPISTSQPLGYHF